MSKSRLVSLLAAVILVQASGLRASPNGPLLTHIQVNAEGVGKHADEKKKEIIAKAQEEKARLEALAIKDAQRIKDLVDRKAEQIKADARHDAIEGKNILIEELECSARNAANGLAVAGGLRMDEATKGNRLLLKLANLFGDGPDPQGRKNLALDFRLSAENDGRLYKYQIIDLSRAVDDQVVHSVTLAQLGLDADCSRHKKLMAVKDGIPTVNTDNLKRTIDEKSNIAGDVKALEIEAGKIKIH
ncbi:MAG: hypothetical protein HY074_06840 [Deltaproteobacteria bacterium]|nr:hypothetical protein [Deltaproteobacteria bacterium]